MLQQLKILCHILPLGGLQGGDRVRKIRMKTRFLTVDRRNIKMR